MKEIELTQGYVAIVDDEDYERFGHLNWYYRKSANGRYGYVIRRAGNKFVRLHREILNAPPNCFVDHRNGNTLDNRKYNLRFCNRRENMCNSAPRPANKTSHYKGVYFAKGRYPSRPWRVQIKCGAKLVSVGYFANEEEAACAYDKAAKQYQGRICTPQFSRSPFGKAR